MTRIALTALLVSLLAAPALAQSEDPTKAPSITPADLKQRREAGTAPAVIDVRTAAEYEAGHIPGALNIPYDRIADRIGEVDTSHGVALYCMVGPRARKGESALLASGYESVLHLAGGLSAWQAKGFPVDTGP
jgi:rhodanese-related sulfurtransferase